MQAQLAACREKRIAAGTRADAILPAENVRGSMRVGTDKSLSGCRHPRLPRNVFPALASACISGKNVSAIMNASEGHEQAKAVKNRALRELYQTARVVRGPSPQAECQR
jgi:hypothetical protein